MTGLITGRYPGPDLWNGKLLASPELNQPHATR